MGDFEFHVGGLDKLNAALLELGTNAAKRAGKKALRAGANVILKATRDAAPVGAKGQRGHPPGYLKNKGLATIDNGVKGDAMTFSVGVKRSAYYAKFIEFGTSKMAAKPFMRPAADTHAEEAVSVMAGVLAEQIEAEAARLK